MRRVRGVAAGLAALGALAGALAFSAAPALAALETPENEVVSAVTATTAHVSGVLNPHATAGGEGGFYGFLYGVSGPAACGEERLVPEPFGEAGIALGLPDEVKEETLTGLQPNAKYTVCLLELNTAQTEEVLSVPVPFETKVAPPSVAEPPTTSTAPTEAHLEGLVNPNNQSTECHVQYGTEATLATSTTVPCEPETLAGYGDQGTLTLPGLTQATTYYYRVIAKNASGAAQSAAIEHLTTLPLEAPKVEGENVSGVTSSEATLEAQVNPNYQETSCEFRYGLEASLAAGTTVPCTPEHLGAGGGAAGASTVVSGLQPGATYYYQVIADNATGHVEGPVQSFTTQGSPLATTGASQGATRNTVLLSGAVDPVGLETTYHFEYISKAGYEAALASSAANPYAQGESTTAVSIGAGYTADAVGPEQIGGLLAGVTYHYALVASNALGVTIGHDATFTTAAPALPIAATDSASGVAQNTANISATINTQGLATNYGFEIGTDTNYGPPTGLGAVGAGANEAVVSLSLSGLQPNTTYHYRIVATNVDGTTYGADMTFTTSVFANAFVAPPPPLPFVTVPAVSFPTEAGTVPVAPKKAVKKKPKKAKHKKKKPAKGKHHRAGSS